MATILGGDIAEVGRIECKITRSSKIEGELGSRENKGNRVANKL